MKPSIISYVRLFWNVRSLHKKIAKFNTEKDFSKIQNIELSLKAHMAPYPAFLHAKSLHKMYAYFKIYDVYLKLIETSKTPILITFLWHLLRVNPSLKEEEKYVLFFTKNKIFFENEMINCRYDNNMLITVWSLYYHVYGVLPPEHVIHALQEDGRTLPMKAWGVLSPVHQGEYMMHYDTHLYYVERTHIHSMLSYCYRHEDVVPRLLAILNHGIWQQGWKTRPVNMSECRAILFWLHEHNKKEAHAVWTSLIALYDTFCQSIKE